MKSKKLTNCKPKVLKFIWVFLFLFSSTSFYVKAGFGNGCYVGGLLYTTNTSKGAKYFYAAPFYNSVCGYKPIPKLNGKCYIYKGTGPLNKNSSYNSFAKSYAADWNEINCPLDDYVWVLLFVAAGFSIIRLRLF